MHALYFHKASGPLQNRVLLKYDPFQLYTLPFQSCYFLLYYSNAILREEAFLFIAQCWMPIGANNYIAAPVVNHLRQMESCLLTFGDNDQWLISQLPTIANGD